MGRLDGKRAIVTGAGSGIGRASALLFASEGAQVIAADIDEAGLADTINLAKESDLAVSSAILDAGKEDQVKALVARASDDMGGLDAVYANAGIVEHKFSLFELEPEDWHRVLTVNLLGPFLMIKHAAPVMKEQKAGSIICTASVAGLRANAGPTAYSASKAGVISLVQTAATELTGSGIRINAICPGLIETGMTKPIFDMAKERGSEGKIGQLNPLRRYGNPPEIAKMALFLASDDASYVNGQAIPVDGGLSSSLPFVPKG